MTIVFVIVPRAKNEQEREEFFKSLEYSHAGEVPYQLFEGNPENSGFDIRITLPDDCIVLGNSWDKHIKYVLENGLPQHGKGRGFVPTWEGYVQGKMLLQSRRPPEGVFPDLKVELPEIAK